MAVDDKKKAQTAQDDLVRFGFGGIVLVSAITAAQRRGMPRDEVKTLFGELIDLIYNRKENEQHGEKTEDGISPTST